jgi:hypothetical protein
MTSKYDDLSTWYEWKNDESRSLKIEAVLRDIDERLKALEGKQEAPAKPPFLVYSGEAVRDDEPTSEPQSINQRLQWLESKVMQLSNAFMNQAFTKNAETNPAPEPTSETANAPERLFHYTQENGMQHATPAQVRAEAVAMGLLDTPRQKVAEAFLHQALLFNEIIKDEYAYGNVADRLRWIANRLEAQQQTAYDLRRMAAVLEEAAKEGTQP